MKLDLIEDADRKCKLRGSSAVDQDVLVTCSLLGLSHRTDDVVHVGNQRKLERQAGGLSPGEDEDRHAIMMVAAPASGRLEGSPAGDDGTCGHELIDDLAVDAAQTAGGLKVIGAACEHPIV
jgi:hypothetical protein